MTSPDKSDTCQIVNRKRERIMPVKHYKNLDLIQEIRFRAKAPSSRKGAKKILRLGGLALRLCVKCLSPFNDHRDALSTTNTGCREAVASAAPVQLVKNS